MENLHKKLNSFSCSLTRGGKLKGTREKKNCFNNSIMSHKKLLHLEKHQGVVLFVCCCILIASFLLVRASSVLCCQTTWQT